MKRKIFSILITSVIALSSLSAFTTTAYGDTYIDSEPEISEGFWAGFAASTAVEYGAKKIYEAGKKHNESYKNREFTPDDFKDLPNELY